MGSFRTTRLNVGLLKANNIYVQHESDDERQRCSGMYGPKAWGGKVDPFILVTFEKKPANDNAAVSKSDHSLQSYVYARRVTDHVE
jgi:hypothetical protein